MDAPLGAMPPQPAAGLEGLRDLGFDEVTTPSVVIQAIPLDHRTVEVIGTRPALGTLVSVTAVVPAADLGQTAIGQAFAELDRQVGTFSRFESASALSVLNERGRLEGAPPELGDVVSRAIGLHGASGGAFDVTVKPLLDLWAGGTPADGEVRDAAALVGTAHLAVGRREIRFARGGMGVTLDGIAKGFIVDRMAAELLRHGVRRFLIDAGGDLFARGRNPRGEAWRVGVRDPAGGEAVPAVIALPHGAVATSGGYARFLDPARTVPHIVTPATGRPPRAAASASVIAPDALTADALATAVFVLGAPDGLRLVERFRGCAAFVLDEAGAAHRSSRWAAFAVRPEEGSIP